MLHDSSSGRGTSKTDDLLNNEVASQRSSRESLEEQVAELFKRVAILQGKIELLQTCIEADTATGEVDQFDGACEHDQANAERYQAKAMVDNWKQELNAQIRSTEIEMALERAKVFRQQAELEEIRIKIKQERSMVLAGTEGVESRLDRHVGFLRSRNK